MRYETLTFDCYGTLIDWRRGIVDAFREAAGADAGELPGGERLLELHARHEAAVQAGPYRSYRQVLGETARRIAAELAVEELLTPFDFLADSLPRWPPFADTVPALARLRRAGARLGILSNVDDDLLAGTLERLGVEFDLLITAEQVRSYKPSPAHFESARRRIGDRAWLHVAQSQFHDIAPAQRLGLPAVWINRLGEPAAPGLQPVEVFDDLAGLAAWLI
jgi:2-haloalkanoic acid dehalogenase type II